MEGNLTERFSIDTTNDNIVIVKCLEDIPGGRTLDVAGWPHTTIPGGHPIIKEGGEYKPIALNAEGTQIDPAQAANTVGILKGTILTDRPFAAIMVRGTVNQEAAVFTIPAECKAPLSLIRFTSDDQ